VKNQHIAFAQRDDFDEIIDVRTPLEYALDHIPGAINAPVLSNEQRVIIGTMFREGRAHEATRLGAAMVARNIADHLDTVFADRPIHWKPMIYCWRGGKRSASMTSMFNLIGWRARQLEGGYKSYRRWVLQTLETRPAEFRYIVLTGHTGTGKTRLLAALARQGAQVLDLEALACHRGSLLGAMPDAVQPSQKTFDSALSAALAGYQVEQPVFIEAESKRIGRITLPIALVECMHQAECVRVTASLDDRVDFLLEDYRALFDEPEQFKQKLAVLTSLHGKEVIHRWHELIDRDARLELSRELIERHYDPAYARSSKSHFTRIDAALPFHFRPNSEDASVQAEALLGELKMRQGLVRPS
jgi:tRNA 2-selenouridine synthase